jgi:hypothetical protein
MKICTPVLPTDQDEVSHCRGRHGNISSPITPISSGRAGLPNDSCHQKVSSRKLAGNRHSLGSRHIGTLGPHHLGCFLRHDCSKDGRRPNTFDTSTSPRVGTSNDGWNSGQNQHRSPHLGGGRSNLLDIHLRATDVEEANHQCFLSRCNWIS